MIQSGCGLLLLLIVYVISPWLGPQVDAWMMVTKRKPATPDEWAAYFAHNGSPIPQVDLVAHYMRCTPAAFPPMLTCAQIHELEAENA